METFELQVEKGSVFPHLPGAPFPVFLITLIGQPLPFSYTLIFGPGFYPLSTDHFRCKPDPFLCNFRLVGLYPLVFFPFGILYDPFSCLCIIGAPVLVLSWGLTIWTLSLSIPSSSSRDCYSPCPFSPFFSSCHVGQIHFLCFLSIFAQVQPPPTRDCSIFGHLICSLFLSVLLSLFHTLPAADMPVFQA